MIYQRFVLGALATLAISVAACSGNGTSSLPAAAPAAVAANSTGTSRTALDAVADPSSAHALAATATATPDSAHALAATATPTPDSAHALAAGATPDPTTPPSPVQLSPVPQHNVCPPTGVHCLSHHSDVVPVQKDPSKPPTPNVAMGPNDLRSLYAVAGGGAGKTIALVDASYDPAAESDLAVYRAAYGLPPCTTANGCFRAVYFHNGQAASVDPTQVAPDPDWAQEISLDIDVASAMCPQCKILLLQNDQADIDQLAMLNDAAVSLGASVISNSYGAPENSTLAADEVHFNHPGIPITASSGDAGAVNYPASSQYVTAVGGTDIVNAYNHKYEQRWRQSGAGCSAIITRPAWQAQNTTCGMRSTPDISVTAGLSPGVAVYDSVPGPDGSYGWMAIGGTSVGAPLVAGMYALSNATSFGTGASLLYTNAARSDLNLVLDPDVTYTTASLTWLAKSYPVLTQLSATGLGSPHGEQLFQNH